MKANLDLFSDGECKYIIAGWETCPTTGRKHYQGYMQLKKRKRFKQLKECLEAYGLKDVHLEPQRGTCEEAIRYCQKEDPDPFVRGLPVNPGKRSDLEEAVVDITDGKFDRIADFAGSHALTYARFSNGLDKLWRLNQKPTYRPLPMIYYWSGPTRTGKSTGMKYFLSEVLKINSSEWFWATNDHAVSQWWQGYRGQEVVIWDDFTGSYPLTPLLRILDANHFECDIKGASHPLNATIFCFTSNYDLRELYREHAQHDAWLKRLDEFGSAMRPRLIRPTDRGFVNLITHRAKINALVTAYNVPRIISIVPQYPVSNDMNVEIPDDKSEISYARAMNAATPDYGHLICDEQDSGDESPDCIVYERPYKKSRFIDDEAL